MSARYEVADTDTEIGIIGPDDTDNQLWDDELPAQGRHALVIGDPWASAYAIVGTRDELAAFAQRLAARRHREHRPFNRRPLASTHVHRLNTTPRRRSITTSDPVPAAAASGADN